MFHVGKNTIENALDVDIAVSDKMFNAMTLWESVYKGYAPWIDNENVFSCNLAAQISSEFARMATIENTIDVTGSPRADYLDECLNNLRQNLRVQTEYGCAWGNLILKPCITGNTLTVDYVKPNAFFPIAFDCSGRITEIVFLDQATVGSTIYNKLEHHTLKNDTVTVKNRVFKSNFSGDLGDEVDIRSVEAWQHLKPVTVIANISQPLYGYFKVPMANQIDEYSPLGVSVFSRAITQIKHADEQYGRFLWEFEGSELAIDAGGPLFLKDEHGKEILPTGRDRLFRFYPQAEKNFINCYSPPIREQSQIAGLNELKKQIEDLCHLARGSISSPDSEAKTATELKILRQRSYATVTDIQKALQFALDDLIYAMDVFTTLYNLAPSGDYNTTYHWDDSIITDEDALRAQRMQEVSSGLMPKWEYRMLTRGEDEATAKAMVEQETITFGMEDSLQDSTVDVQGKALNGAQTQSLIAIMAQYSAKEITEGQAINLISTAIGIEKDEARRILNGEL